MNASTMVYLYLFPLMVIILVIDLIQMPKVYNRQDCITNFTIFGISVGLKSFTKILELSVYMFFFSLLADFRESSLSYSEIDRQWWALGIGVILSDFLYYWFHRLGHEVRILWANHIVHHSSEHYNFTTSLRISWWTHFFKFIFWTPMAMIGFHPLFIVYAIAIVDVYQYFLHTQNNRDFGWLEGIFNTPKLHEVHHAKNPEYIDKNYGGILIIWDRLFGTYKPWDGDNLPIFGVSNPPEKNTVFEVITHEFVNIWRDLKKTNRWSEKWKILFASPAWSVQRFKKTTGNSGRLIQHEFKKGQGNNNLVA